MATTSTLCGNVAVPLLLVLLALRLALPRTKRTRPRVGAAGGRWRHPMAAVAGLHLPVFPHPAQICSHDGMPQVTSHSSACVKGPIGGSTFFQCSIYITEGTWMKSSLNMVLHSSFPEYRPCFRIVIHSRQSAVGPLKERRHAFGIAVYFSYRSDLAGHIQGDRSKQDSSLTDYKYSPPCVQNQ
jgi:hypothetical protein